MRVLQPDTTGYYRVFTMRPDGDRRSIENPALPAKHREALPGFGRHNDIGLVTADT